MTTKYTESKDHEKLDIAELMSNDISFEIRLEGYRKFGFIKKAFKDDYEITRHEAYKQLGYPEEALKDSYMWIRLDAYKQLGFTKEALYDKESYIRRVAYAALGPIKSESENKHQHTKTKLNIFTSLKKLFWRKNDKKIK